MKRDSSAQAGARRLLFLWDADAFGGHDRMALDGLGRLAGEAELTLGVLHTGRNSRLEEELERIARQTGRLEVIRAQAAPAASESIDGLWGGPRTRSLMDAIGRWRPDCAVAVQGFITLGLCALGACRKLHVPVVSYVPMTHRIWLLRRAPVSILQDFLNRFWYAVPAAFITISARMKDKLVREQIIPSDFGRAVGVHFHHIHLRGIAVACRELPAREREIFHFIVAQRGSAQRRKSALPNRSRVIQRIM